MEEMIEALAALSHAQQKQAVIVVEQPVHSPGHEMAVPERLQHTDAVFAQDREASAVAGWLGVWTGSLLLKDILKDNFATPADEDERQQKLKAHAKDCDCC